MICFSDSTEHGPAITMNSSPPISTPLTRILLRAGWNSLLTNLYAICDATPGPVSRIVKTAILNRDRGRERVREAVEEAGLTEVPRLEEKLNLLATIAQIAPLLGLLGTIIGLMDVFSQMQEAGLYANFGQISHGIWRALICAAAGIAVAIPVHAGYNYLVSRINKIVLDMERAAAEIVNIVTENGNGHSI